SPFRLPLGYALQSLARSLWRQGVRGKHRASYWRYLARAVRQTPRRFSRAIGLAINAEHMIRYTEEEVLPRLRASLVEARRPPRGAGAASGDGAAAAGAAHGDGVRDR